MYWISKILDLGIPNSCPFFFLICIYIYVHAQIYTLSFIALSTLEEVTASYVFSMQHPKHFQTCSKKEEYY